MSAAITSQERPIVFSAPMVRAILGGRKTQTRRLVKPQSEGSLASLADYSANGSFGLAGHIDSPYGLPGDRLWVRETFSISGNGYFYRADTMQPETVRYAWNSPIHMPRKASRLTLEITRVRVERLQDIGKDGRKANDVLAEGITEAEIKHWRKWLHPDDAPAHAYGILWNSIHRKTHRWEDNPWVWVIEFKWV